MAPANCFLPELVRGLWLHLDVSGFRPVRARGGQDIRLWSELLA
jgi:hypothetical protein